MATETPVDKQLTETFRSIWFGLAVIRRRPGEKRRIRVRWAYLTAVSLAGITALWLLAGLGLYFFFKFYRGFQDERYLDALTLPFHLKQHDHKMGEYYLRLADLHVKNQRWGEAMQDYRLGVMKVPEDLHGREMLSQFYLLAYKDQLDRSLTVIEDGLPYAVKKDPEYVNRYLMTLQEHHFPDKIIDTCKLYLAKNLPNAQVRKAFAVSLASVLIEQGRFDEAEDAITRYKLNEGIDGVLVNSRLLWERGRHRAAVDFLESALRQMPNNDYIFMLLSHYYRELGDLDKARQYIVLRALNAPTSVGPRIELLYIYAKTGDNNRMQNDTRKIIEQFSGDEASMFQLINFAADQGDMALAHRLYDLAAKNPKFSLARFATITVEAHLAAGDYDGALQLIDELGQQNFDWYPANKQIMNSLRAVANYGIGRADLADIFLTGMLKNNNERPDTLTAIANRFISLGGMTQAQRLLQSAYEVDPHSQAILTQLVTVDLQLGSSENLRENIQGLLQTRRPSLELLLDAYRKLGSDRFIFVPQREKLLEEMNKYIQDATKNHQDIEP